jgi:hypothetical protein
MSNDDNNQGGGPIGPETATGRTSVNIRIKELNEAITESKDAFKIRLTELEQQICNIIGAIAVLLLIFSFLIYYAHDEGEHKIPVSWIELIFKSTVRIIVATAVFSIGSFLIKILSEHITLFQKTKQKHAILQSFASLVESAADAEQSKLIHQKLVGIVVSYDNTEPESSTFTEHPNTETILKMIDTAIKAARG